MSTPNWPAAINYLAERGSWNKVPNEPVLRSEFDVGPARARRRFTSQVSRYSLTIQMSEDEYVLFEGFFQDDLRAGAAWFNMPFYMGRGGYEVKPVRFTEPYQVRDAGFRQVKVSAKLEVKMTPIISGGAVYFVETYGEQSLFDLSDELDPIVNETYPDIMENY
jgi:hypothetical protein